MTGNQNLSNRVAGLERKAQPDDPKSFVIVRTFVSPPKERNEPFVGMARGHGWQVWRGHREPLDRFKTRCICAARDAGSTIDIDVANDGEQTPRNVS